jgi:hypothetical protein
MVFDKNPTEKLRMAGEASEPCLHKCGTRGNSGTLMARARFFSKQAKAKHIAELLALQTWRHAGLTTLALTQFRAR